MCTHDEADKMGYRRIRRRGAFGSDSLVELYWMCGWRLRPRIGGAA